MGVPLVVLAGAIVPHPGEHAAPPCVSVQLTPRLVVPVTVGVKVCVCPTTTVAVAGDTETVTPWTIVIVAEADLVVSATEVAVTVTVAFGGAAAGAVYVVGEPLAVLVGAIAPHTGEHAAPPCVSVQVTPVLFVPVTVAVNACVWLKPTLAVAGDTATLTL